MIRLFLIQNDKNQFFSSGADRWVDRVDYAVIYGDCDLARVDIQLHRIIGARIVPMVSNLEAAAIARRVSIQMTVTDLGPLPIEVGERIARELENL
jgi:hypothetical protein